MCWVRLRPIEGDTHDYLSRHRPDLRRSGVGTWHVSWNGRPTVFHRPQLVLITCGGRFDADRRYCDANVVWARLVTVSG
jgi:hypothetical protein